MCVPCIARGDTAHIQKNLFEEVVMDKNPFPIDQTALRQAQRENAYDTLAIVLLAFWLVAVGAGYTLHGFIYIFLAGAIMVALIRLTQNWHANRVPVFLTIRRKK